MTTPAMTATTVNELPMTESPDSYSSNVSELVTSLRGNSSIKEVRFAGKFLCGLSQQDKLALLGQVGQLKSLKERNASVQASLLSKVVEAARYLYIFSLGCVELEGNRDDFMDLEFSIRHHQALAQLVWEDFAFVVKALSMVRTLEVVKLVASQNSNMSLTGLSLTSLRESLSLPEMHLSRFQLDKMAFTMISWAIKTTQLNSLALTDCAVDNEVCVNIAAAVRPNNCSERLDLTNNMIGDDGCQSLADGLIANMGLKCRIGARGYRAVARMVEENHSLELERLGTPVEGDQDCCNQIDECLKNNHQSNSNHSTGSKIADKKNSNSLWRPTLKIARDSPTIDHLILNGHDTNKDKNNTRIATTDTQGKELCMFERRRLRLDARTYRLANSCEGAPKVPA